MCLDVLANADMTTALPIEPITQSIFHPALVSDPKPRSTLIEITIEKMKALAIFSEITTRFSQLKSAPYYGLANPTFLRKKHPNISTHQVVTTAKAPPTFDESTDYHGSYYS